ncbi:MAG: nucleotidyltransferase family protein [Armatimonadetes bacterium]|nr:nucleotidyltransferase family protein [Armatimonadota bacterium]MDE2206829.1 nucleotidyltransferase family protein [Armatimonadota bacterium]
MGELKASSEGIPVVVLAGGKSRPELAAATGAESRANVKLGGIALLDRVLAALSAARSGGAPLGAVIVVTSAANPPDCTLVADAGGFVENLFAGLSAAGAAESCLISTCDIPFVTAGAITHLTENAGRLLIEGEADLVWPIVPVATCYEKYPGVKRTAIKVREGQFTGGNMMLARPAALLAKRSRIAQVYGARKSPLRLAMMLGPSAVARLAVSQTAAPGALPLAWLERRASAIIGARARALISPYAELATDLDRASDFEAAEAFIRRDSGEAGAE